jgi:ATP-dependent DNA helicase PIF1
MILSPRNSDVADLNARILDMMSGEADSFLSVDSVVDEAGVDDGISGSNTLPSEFLQTLNPSCLPPGNLQLKPGCPLILLQNLCPARGLCNGTRMVLARMSRRVLEVKLLGGEHNGELALIPRITLAPTEGQTGLAFVLK